MLFNLLYFVIHFFCFYFHFIMWTSQFAINNIIISRDRKSLRGSWGRPRLNGHKFSLSYSSMLSECHPKYYPMSGVIEHYRSFPVYTWLSQYISFFYLLVIFLHYFLSISLKHNVLRSDWKQTTWLIWSISNVLNFSWLSLYNTSQPNF